MSSGSSFTILPLSFKDRKPYEQFSDSWEEDSLAFGASLEGEPVGLILAKKSPIIHTAEVLTVFVKQDHRQKGIENALLQALEHVLRKQKIQVVLFSYSEIGIEQVLHDLKWHSPRLHQIKCTFNGFEFNPPWLNRRYSIAQEFGIFPWSELYPEEQQKLQRLIEQKVIPHEISPFENEATIEKSNSLGLRHKGSVVGWAITHRISPDTIRYSALYVKREFQHTGIAIKMLCESIKLQQKAQIKWAILTVNVLTTEGSWLSFIEKRLVPYAQKVIYTKQAWKILE